MRTLVCTVLLAAGCGPTVEELMAQNAPAAEAMKKKIAAVAALVQAAPPPAAGATCKAPAALHFQPKVDGHDTDLMLLDVALAGGENDEMRNDKKRFDMYLITPLDMYLAWTVTPTNRSEARERASQGMKDDIRRALAVKSLLIIRPGHAERARGELPIDVFLTDLDAGKVVCGFRIVGHASPSLGVEEQTISRVNLKTGERNEVRTNIIDKFEEAMWTDARSTLHKQLQAQLGIDIGDL
jgi:hypothetical protein